MANRRQPREIWNGTRKNIFRRDRGCCTHCEQQLPLNKAHIDHIVPLKAGGSNHAKNLRTLCPRCHALRRDKWHQGMKAGALKKGVIPPGWRNLAWD